MEKNQTGFEKCKVLRRSLENVEPIAYWRTDDMGQLRMNCFECGSENGSDNVSGRDNTGMEE